MQLGVDMSFCAVMATAENNIGRLFGDIGCLIDKMGKLNWYCKPNIDTLRVCSISSSKSK